MNKSSVEKQAQIIRCLVEGNSIRSTVRITGAAKNTVTKLLVDVGRACAEYQNKVFRNLSCTCLQCDEIWSFCYSKEKNTPKELRGNGRGDVWTWTAICADTKLVPAWLIGNRDVETGTIFMRDLASRLKRRVQITTDGLKVYLRAVENAFGAEVDFAQLIKIYGKSSDEEKRYSPSEYIESIPTEITGRPDPKKISTSYAERQNLTMRMCMRRFTRLTNGFSKKIENHAHAVALHFMYYNFCRIHKSLRVTPAMEAGITDKVWNIEDIVGLL